MLNRAQGRRQTGCHAVIFNEWIASGVCATGKRDQGG